MIDAATRELLQTLVRRESRSLLQYLREVPPWSAAADRPAVEKLRALALDERTATDLVGKFLEKRRIGLSHLGPYPSVFTDSNDAAFGYILPRVVREQKQLVSTLEADAAKVTDADARVLLERLLHLKQQHLPQLEGLASKPYSFTSVA